MSEKQEKLIKGLIGEGYGILELSNSHVVLKKDRTQITIYQTKKK